MSNMNFTVEELAEYIDVRADDLIERLQEERDDINWTYETVVQADIADTFVTEFDMRRNKRQTKLSTTPQTGIELTPQYFADQQKDIKIALRRTIADLSIGDIIAEGVQDGFEEIQAYEKGKTATWMKYAEMVTENNEMSRQENSKRRQEIANQIASDNFAFLAKLQELRDEAEVIVNDSKKYYQQMTGESGK